MAHQGAVAFSLLWTLVHEAASTWKTAPGTKAPSHVALFLFQVTTLPMRGYF